MIPFLEQRRGSPRDLLEDLCSRREVIVHWGRLYSVMTLHRYCLTHTLHMVWCTRLNHRKTIRAPYPAA